MGLLIGKASLKLVDEGNNVLHDFGSYYIADRQYSSLYNTNPVHVIIKDSLFEGNIAANGNGGAIVVKDDIYSYDHVPVNYIGEKDFSISIADKPDDMSLEEFIYDIQWNINNNTPVNLFDSKESLEKVYAGLLFTDKNALEIVNTSFINNKANSEDYWERAHGGAIYSNSNIKISADAGTSLFSGNKAITPTEDGASNVDYEAIYLEGDKYNPEDASSRINLTLEAKNKGLVQFDDKINGKNSYNLLITGDETGVVRLNNDVKAHSEPQRKCLNMLLSKRMNILQYLFILI